MIESNSLLKSGGHPVECPLIDPLIKTFIIFHRIQLLSDAI